MAWRTEHDRPLDILFAGTREELDVWQTQHRCRAETRDYSIMIGVGVLIVGAGLRPIRRLHDDAEASR